MLSSAVDRGVNFRGSGVWKLRTSTTWLTWIRDAAKSMISIHRPEIATAIPALLSEEEVSRLYYRALHDQNWQATAEVPAAVGAFCMDAEAASIAVCSRRRNSGGSSCNPPSSQCVVISSPSFLAARSMSNANTPQAMAITAGSGKLTEGQWLLAHYDESGTVAPGLVCITIEYVDGIGYKA